MLDVVSRRSPAHGSLEKAVSSFKSHWHFMIEHGITKGHPTPWDFDVWARSQDVSFRSSDVSPLGLFDKPLAN